MGSLFWRAANPSHCVLCDGDAPLTGEHRIKKSIISRHTPKGAFSSLMQNRSGDRRNTYQSSGSKKLHFTMRLCAKCNNQRTQSGDRAFDDFTKNLEESTSPRDAVQDNASLLRKHGSQQVFRYFSKLICMHITEAGGPVPRTVAAHAVGRSPINRIWCRIRPSKAYAGLVAPHGSTVSLVGGSLIAQMAPGNLRIDGFASSYSIGPFQHMFWFNLLPIERLELKKRYSDFWNMCLSDVQAQSSGGERRNIDHYFYD